MGVFSANVAACQFLEGRGLALWIEDIEGDPQVGDVFDFVGAKRTIIEVDHGRNGTGTWSTISCLTARKVSPYGGILIAWDETRAPGERESRISGGPKT